jgi:general secretion pathway protein D
VSAVSTSAVRRTARGVWAVAVSTALLVACAPGRELVRNGQKQIDQGEVEAGLSQLEKAVALEPRNNEYRMQLIRQRDTQLGALLTQADAARNADRIDAAAALYQRALGIDANNTRASAGVESLVALRRQQQRLDEVQALLAQNRYDEARQRLRQALADNPTHPRTLALQRQLDEVAASATAATPAAPVLDANLKAVFEALSRTTGINFVFDREVKSDIKVTLSIANLSIDDVIDVLVQTNQLGRKTLNDHTVLIYPNTAAKQKDYVELSVKTFYLANAEAKTVLTMLKTVLKSKDVYANDKLNSLTMRDSADAIHLAEKLIAAQDLAEPEVLLDVEVLEVKRSRLMEIGIDPPGKFTLLNIVPNPDTVVNSGTGSTILKNTTSTTTQLTLDRLRNIRSSSIGIDNPSVNVRAENGDTNILANPRIRVKNRDKARILIGDRVPVITTTSTANVGVSESVSYLDVGLKLEVEPNVFLDNEVGVNVSLEVSNIVREVRSRSGTLTYQIGTRLATTALRLKDGETQALAGLISDEDRKGAVGLPWLIDLPVLGRLFSSERSDHSKTEIVLLITPRVVRNLATGTPGRNEHAGGTESVVGAPQLRLGGQGKMSMPVAGGRAPVAAAGDEPAPVEPDAVP